MNDPPSQILPAQRQKAASDMRGLLMGRDDHGDVARIHLSGAANKALLQGASDRDPSKIVHGLSAHSSKSHGIYKIGSWLWLFPRQ